MVFFECHLTTTNSDMMERIIQRMNPMGQYIGVSKIALMMTTPKNVTRTIPVFPQAILLTQCITIAPAVNPFTPSRNLKF